MDCVGDGSRHVLVLLSGGMDSAACVAFYASLGYSMSALHVSYGQGGEMPEAQAAEAISAHYGIPLLKASCMGLGRWGAGPIPARNAMLLTGALMVCGAQRGLVAIGVHSGTAYADCSGAFLDAMQSVFDFYADGQTVVVAPFLHWSKRDIWHYGRQVGVPFHLAYSCEAGDFPPCGRCDSCRDQEALHASEG